MRFKRRDPLGLQAILLSTVLALATVGPAGAEVEIEYDLGMSRITAFSGLVELGAAAVGGAPIGGASARITLSGALHDPEDGPALIEDFQLGDVPIDESLFDLLALQGTASAQQIGAALGQLVDERTVILSQQFPFALATEGSIVCTPYAYCGSIGSFPLDLAGIQSLTPLAFELRGLDVQGRSTLHGQIPLELDGHQAVVNLVGVEVSRRFVPEPGAFAQLAAGCVGLLGIHRLHGLTRRRRTRRS